MPNVPVAYCNECQEKIPVIIQDITVQEVPELDEPLQVIYCPACSNILNSNGGCRVEWYDASEIHTVTNYKYVETNPERNGES